MKSLPQTAEQERDALAARVKELEQEISVCKAIIDTEPQE